MNGSKVSLVGSSMFSFHFTSQSFLLFRDSDRFNCFMNVFDKDLESAIASFSFCPIEGTLAPIH